MSTTAETHTKVLFDHDRTCCVCRDSNKKFIQIHHIDGNKENNNPDNLAVLCLDCHTETQLKGGFYKKLSPNLVTRYRDEWIDLVRRAKQSMEYSGIVKSVPTMDLTQPFVQQLIDNNILPQDAIFHFTDYYFLTPGFPTIVISSDTLTPDNGDLRKSVIKAYLLCVLGNVAPQGMLVSNTLRPDMSVNKVNVEKVMIAVPRWFVKGFEELTHLHLTGQYDQYSNQILLTLAPMLKNTGLNYDLLGLKLKKIAQELKGTTLKL